MSSEENWNSPSNLSFVCQQKWDDLQLTDQEDVRFCVGCQKKVYFCRTSEDFLTHSTEGNCVAFNGKVECSTWVSRLVGVLPGFTPGYVGMGVANPFSFWMFRKHTPKKPKNP